MMSDPSACSILLVEDNPGDARLINEMLGRVPEFNLCTAETLTEALDLAGNTRCDVILLDLSLPDSAGLETVRSIQRVYPHIPLVVLTGFDDEQQGIEAVQAGAQDYLVKGDTDARSLERAIRYARERHHAEEALRRSEQAYRSLIDDVFDASSVAVLIFDSSLKAVWVNAATEKYFGISRDDILTYTHQALVSDKLKCLFEDPDGYEQHLLRSLQDGGVTDAFECHIMPDDQHTERWLQHWSQPIHQGLFAGGRIEQYTDITDRKQAELAEQEQRRFAEALRATAESLISTLNYDDVLARIVDNVDTVMPNDGVSITVERGDGTEIVRSRGGDIIESNEMYRLQVPITLQDEVIGGITVYSSEPAARETAARERLKAFAAQAALAIQNARHYQQSQEMATYDERQRLARELHDSVSQTLFSGRTMSEAALRQWTRSPERARGYMNEVYRLLETALAEMRILLLELRPSSLMQVGLKQLFEQYLQAALGQQTLNLHLDVADIPPLPPEVQIALYRIVQEAISNVIKHAEAQNVTLQAVVEGSSLTLTVRDDGHGFMTSERSGASLGLEIMRERADTIGAALGINSSEQGTEIRVSWIRQGEEVK